VREHLLLTARDIEEIKGKIERYDWARNLFERIRTDDTFLVMQKEEVTTGQMAMKYVWEEGRFVRDRSLAYALTGDDTDIPAISGILEERFLGDWQFPNLDMSIHLAVPFTFESMIHYWSFWLLLANHVHGFTLIRKHGSFDLPKIGRYEESFRRALEAKKVNYGEYLELHNCQFWDLTCLGVLGVLLEDDEAVDTAINGHYGFKQMLSMYFDGLFWHEATVYAWHYMSSCAIMLAEACMKNGYENLYEYVSPAGGSIKAMFDGWIRTAFAGGRIATCGEQGNQAAVVDEPCTKSSLDINDAFLFNNESYRDSNKFEIAYRVYKDPAYAWLLSLNSKRDSWDHAFWGYPALTHGVPIGVITVPAAESAMFPQYGAAMVRSDESDKYWLSDALAIYARNGSIQGHSQDDHYNIVLNAFGKNIYPDWFYGWDYRGAIDPATGKQRHRSPFSGTLFGHNTVSVDGRTAVIYEAKILPLERSGEMQILRMISGVDGGAYRNVYARRTLGVLPEYVVDIFSLRSREKHLYDYVIHSYGIVSAEGLEDYREHSLQDVRDLYGFQEIDTLAHNEDNLWIRPGHRGSSSDSWSAVFIDEDTIGCRLHMTGDESTEVILSNTPYYVSSYGWDAMPVDGIVRKLPLLIARRKAHDTIFTAVHQPFKGHAEPLSIQQKDGILTVKSETFFDTLNLETMIFHRE
jgi:hypothetical protein